MTDKFNKNGFTMVEAMIILAIAAFISLITAVTVKNVKENVDVMALKKSMLDFNSALASVIGNNMYYSSEDGLSDLSLDSVGTVAIQEKKYKFRSLMLNELEISSVEPMQCAAYLTSSNIDENSTCYQRDNGIVFSIPDTDFNTVNMVKMKDPSGFYYKYLPVTIYPNSKFLSTKDEFNKYAIVIGVRSDGTTLNINSVNCSNSSYSKYNQCKLMEYLTKK